MKREDFNPNYLPNKQIKTVCGKPSVFYLDLSVSYSPALRHKEIRHISIFHREQLYFLIDSSGVPGEAPIRADDTVAGDNQQNGVMSDRSANCLCGHPIKSMLFGYFVRNLSVGHSSTEGNGEHNFPYLFSKLRRAHGERWGEIRCFAAEIDVEPFGSFIKNRQSRLEDFILQCVSKIFLVVEPKPDQAVTVACECDTAERRVIVICVIHI